ncbi:MAG: prepilin-type N-terminal cleavage/methylation domain-containing protein [Oscillospiraceae bacterium]|nr:prepilin-type N-terminal cleavage/methylation domain-containing protein [Oscillospiraceae bacterium]
MVRDFKKVKAFTLVEVIIVIVIIGILAVILVPTLISYISKSKLATANTNAKLAFESAAAYCTDCNINNSPVERGTYNEICLKSAQIPTEAATDGNHLEDALLIAIGSKSAKSGYASVSVNDKGLPQDARWAKKTGDKYVGSYPERASEASQYELSY